MKQDLFFCLCIIKRLVNNLKTSLSKKSTENAVDENNDNQISKDEVIKLKSIIESF